MDGLWVIIVIVALIYRFINKVGDMKEKIPEWEFPWDEENEGDRGKEWDVYAESPDKGAFSPKTITNKMENPIETQSNLQQESEPELVKHPLMDSEILVNGLILSELLKPPKSRRTGRHF